MNHVKRQRQPFPGVRESLLVHVPRQAIQRAGARMEFGRKPSRHRLEQGPRLGIDAVEVLQRVDDGTLITLENLRVLFDRLFVGRQGSVPVFVELTESDGTTVVLRSGRYRVAFDEALTHDCEALLGTGHARYGARL